MKKTDYIFLSLWITLMALTWYMPDRGAITTSLAAVLALIQLVFSKHLVGGDYLLARILTLVGSNFGIIPVLILTSGHLLHLGPSAYWAGIAINLFGFGLIWYLCRKQEGAENIKLPALFVLLACMACLINVIFFM